MTLSEIDATMMITATEVVVDEMMTTMVVEMTITEVVKMLTKTVTEETNRVVTHNKKDSIDEMMMIIMAVVINTVVHKEIKIIDHQFKVEVCDFTSPQ